MAKPKGNKDYKIVQKSEYDIYLDMELPHVFYKKYIVVPNFNRDFKSISMQDSDEELLEKFSFMLRKNKEKHIQAYLNQYDEKRNINQLLLGLYHFSRQEYEEALKQLNEFESSTFFFLKYQLIADCHYELSSNKVDLKPIVNYYQSAYDISTDLWEKELIENRVKILKYSR